MRLEDISLNYGLGVIPKLAAVVIVIVGEILIIVALVFVVDVYVK